MSALKTIRVFIADDSAALREHVLELMQVPGVKIVGMASERAEAVASIRQMKPDVLLLDIQLPQGLIARLTGGLHSVEMN